MLTIEHLTKSYGGNVKAVDDRITSYNVCYTKLLRMVINSGASLLRNSFYAYQEITPATETVKAVYDWVMIKDLGAFSFLV